MSQSKFTKQTRQEIESRVRSIVDALPHRAAMREGDVHHWIDHVVGTHGELAVWHAKRAGGFGGSQIGALVRNFMGQRADHMTSARDIVEGTLLRSVPDEPTGAMHRGIAMESEHRNWFFRKYGAKRDEVGFSALSSGVGPRAWMRYSPDELAFMSDPLGADLKIGRWLGDYKAPTQVDHSSGVAFQYVCQLHMGRLVCANNGVEIDGMILSQFDWQNWATKEDVVPYNPSLDSLIMQAGDHYWDFVERGELPPYVRKERLDDAQDAVKALSDDAWRLSRLKAMGKQFKDEADVLQAQMTEVLGKLRFGSSKLDIEGSLSVAAVAVFDNEKVREVLTDQIVAGLPLNDRSSSKYDTEKLVAHLRTTLAPGQKMKDFYAPGSFKTDALYEALLDAGVDADAFMGEQLRISVASAVKKESEAFFKREFAQLLTPQAAAQQPEEIESSRGVEGDVRHAPRLLPA